MATQEILAALETDLSLSGKSPSTCTTYMACVRYFSAYVGKSLVQTERSDVVRFVRHISQERRLTPATVKTYVCALLFAYRVTLGKTPNKRASQGPRSRFMAAPTIPKQQPKAKKKAKAQPVRSTVRSY